MIRNSHLRDNIPLASLYSRIVRNPEPVALLRLPSTVEDGKLVESVASGSVLVKQKASLLLLFGPLQPEKPQGDSKCDNECKPSCVHKGSSPDFIDCR